jgi:hypothetical protein
MLQHCSNIRSTLHIHTNQSPTHTSANAMQAEERTYRSIAFQILRPPLLRSLLHPPPTRSLSTPNHSMFRKLIHPQEHSTNGDIHTHPPHPLSHSLVPVPPEMPRRPHRILPPPSRRAAASPSQLEELYDGVSRAAIVTFNWMSAALQQCDSHHLKHTRL